MELILSLVIQPKASRDQIVGWLGDEIKVAITAPPVDGKANEHLRRYLAKICGTSFGKVTVVKGETNRHKTVKIEDYKKIRDELKLAIKAIRKYDSKGELVHLHNRNDKGEYNKLALSLHILQDYFENGVYTNIQEIIETNGEGEIDWDRTINETFAYIKNNRPYYLELKTRSSQNDDFDYFKRLHECIVTQCSKYLKELTILDFFDMSEVLLSELDLKDFGDKDYILYRLEREIANQFITRKQNLLKTLYTFVATSGTSSQENSYSLYGTNCMNLVWEKACGQIFGNIHDQVKSEIKKPQWFLNGGCFESDTLIPDIITKCVINDSEVFCILDGKYYLVKADSCISGNPGVQDVIKQFAYHESFHDYLRTQHCESVFNAFLFPLSDARISPEKDILIRGFVTMDFSRKRHSYPWLCDNAEMGC